MWTDQRWLAHALEAEGEAAESQARTECAWNRCCAAVVAHICCVWQGEYKYEAKDWPWCAMFTCSRLHVPDVECLCRDPTAFDKDLVNSLLLDARIPTKPVRMRLFSMPAIRLQLLAGLLLAQIDISMGNRVGIDSHELKKAANKVVTKLRQKVRAQEKRLFGTDRVVSCRPYSRRCSPTLVVHARRAGVGDVSAAWPESGALLRHLQRCRRRRRWRWF